MPRTYNPMFTMPPSWIKRRKDLLEDDRLTSYLPYYMAKDLYMRDGINPTDSQVVVLAEDLKPIHQLYTFIDHPEMVKNNKQRAILILQKAFDTVKEYPVHSLSPFSGLVRSKCLTTNDSDWLSKIQKKIIPLMKALEDKYLPHDQDLLPRIGSVESLPPNRFGIYYRVSTDQQDTESQKHEVQKYIDSLPQDQKPYSLKVYEDKGISGKKDNRPEFQQLLSDIETKKIDTVLVYKLDRLTRSSSTAIRLLLDFEDKQINFISLTQPFLSSNSNNPFRKTILAMFSELAQIERESIVERVRAGLSSARAKGVTLGRPQLYTEDQRSQIIDLYKNHNLTRRQIADRLHIKKSYVKYIIAVYNNTKNKN